jgi:hypothetical protein
MLCSGFLRIQTAEPGLLLEDDLYPRSTFSSRIALTELEEGPNPNPETLAQLVMVIT